MTGTNPRCTGGKAEEANSGCLGMLPEEGPGRLPRGEKMKTEFQRMHRSSVGKRMVHREGGEAVQESGGTRECRVFGVLEATPF